MNNKENYKKAVDQIHASDELKEKAFENAKYAKSNNYTYLRILSTCAVFFIVFLVGFSYFNGDIENLPGEVPVAKEEFEQKIELANAELPRFESMEQLKSVLKESNRGFYDSDMYLMSDMVVTDSMATNSAVSKGEEVAELESAVSDYSTTNTQEENVDEADIVKTDGEYIYYVSNNKVFIVKADNLEVVSEIYLSTEKETLRISEIYIKENKLVILGNGYLLQEPEISSENKEDSVRVNSIGVAKAFVFDIEDKTNPEKLREVSLEGRYMDSRMVEDNLYLISRKTAYWYDGVEDYTILPALGDSVTSNEIKRVDCTDIIYFEGTDNSSFMIVGGFNINSDEEVSVETFFGAGEQIYASENNLYLTQTNYEDYVYNTTIYKFKLNNSRIELLAKGTVNGNVNDQFSMDEYDGNLRIATTSVIVLEPEKTEEYSPGIMRTTIAKTTTVNNLYVLNENLEEIGRLEDLAPDEKIYSARFIGDVGYIVTFKQIDPLFVIDLSDPTNPTVKGELKIPGYSSYLHPYDENHVIGIGYNTEENGYGGTVNTTMKMSMFDVSDLENPQEIFNVDIGTDYAYSEITYNHKVLLYKKSENLIGFPVTTRSNNYYNSENGFMIFRIDLENNEFAEYGKIMEELDYRTDVERVIYIEDKLYTLSRNYIISYDLNTLEQINKVELSQTEEPLTDTIWLE